MATHKPPNRSAPSSDPLDLVKRVQRALKDREGAVCLAARTGRDYREGEICGKKADAKRHTISRKAYLRPMAQDGCVLSTLPIDAPHIAHHTLTSTGRGLRIPPSVSHLPPKPISIWDASTWHFACQQDDDKFKAVDTGIRFPVSTEYRKITTDTVSEGATALEEALFLMAYRSVLSSLSILKGVYNSLRQLRIERGNHQPIVQQARSAYKNYDQVLKLKRPYDGRFAGVQDYKMTHHLIAAPSHTRLALTKVVDYATIAIIPDNNLSRIVVSHAANEPIERQREAKNWVLQKQSELSDSDNKEPFIDLVADTFDAYISPADYAEWSEQDRDALERAAATSVMQFLGY